MVGEKQGCAKTWPSGFNWFEPGFNGFLGYTGENSDNLCRFRIEEPNLENKKIILHIMDNCQAISISQWVTYDPPVSIRVNKYLNSLSLFFLCGFSVWFKPVSTGWVKLGWVLPDKPW